MQWSVTASGSSLFPFPLLPSTLRALESSAFICSTARWFIVLYCALCHCYISAQVSHSKKALLVCVCMCVWVCVCVCLIRLSVKWALWFNSLASFSASCVICALWIFLIFHAHFAAAGGGGQELYLLSISQCIHRVVRGWPTKMPVAVAGATTKWNMNAHI